MLEPVKEYVENMEDVWAIHVFRVYLRKKETPPEETLEYIFWLEPNQFPFPCLQRIKCYDTLIAAHKHLNEYPERIAYWIEKRKNL